MTREGAKVACNCCPSQRGPFSSACTKQDRDGLAVGGPTAWELSTPPREGFAWRQSSAPAFGGMAERGVAMEGAWPFPQTFAFLMHPWSRTAVLDKDLPHHTHTRQLLTLVEFKAKRWWTCEKACEKLPI